MSAYRDELSALSARHDALASEVASKTRELADAAHLLRDAQARARLPVLDNIRIATPCTADWEQMTGDARVRACAQCNKNVYNLSEMTREEAQALIVEKEGALCARYYQRKDGTILLKDCEIGVMRKRRRRLVAAGAMAMLAGGGALLVRGSRGAPTIATEVPTAVQGGATTIDVVPVEPVANPLVSPPIVPSPPSYRMGAVSLSADPPAPPPRAKRHHRSK